MTKILTEVFVPAVGKSFDIYIPDRTELYQVAAMIESAVSKLDGVKYIPSGNGVLCDRRSGTVFDSEKNASELCLHNGSKLMLI